MKIFAINLILSKILKLTRWMTNFCRRLLELYLSIYSSNRACHTKIYLNNALDNYQQYSPCFREECYKEIAELLKNFKMNERQNLLKLNQMRTSINFTILS